NLLERERSLTVEAVPQDQNLGLARVEVGDVLADVLACALGEEPLERSGSRLVFDDVAEPAAVCLVAERGVKTGGSHAKSSQLGGLGGGNVQAFGDLGIVGFPAKSLGEFEADAIHFMNLVGHVHGQSDRAR